MNRAAVYGTVWRWLRHDLRGPAQAISLVCDLLEQGDGLADPALQEILRTGSARLRELLDLVDRASRAPPTSAEAGPVALGSVIEHVAALHDCNLAQVRLDTAAVPLRSLPAVRGREDQLAHALLNLVVNAHEAVAQRVGKTIRLSGGAAPDGGMVTLVVEDDGPGPAPDVRDRLFELFVTTKIGGPLAGLGLPVARRLLAESGGSVRYEPAARGARFVVALTPWRSATG